MTRWWRHTWTFQLAHGPLCKRHRKHVVRLGRLWLCRSCLALYGTAALAVVAALLLRPTAFQATWACVGVGVPVLLLSVPPVYERHARLVRDVLRAGAGALVGLAVAWVFVGVWWVGLVLLAVFLALFVLYARVRRRRRHLVCEGCVELERDGVCSGYRRQAVYIRRHEEETSRILEAKLAPLLRERDPGRPQRTCLEDPREEARIHRA